jgi:mRNA interferase MazF
MPQVPMASANFERYSVYRADLNPSQSSEINKVRPVVVVSLDTLNQALERVVICPLTTKLHPRWRSRLQLRCRGRLAEIAVDQMRAISKTCLGTKLDRLTNKDAADLRLLISEMYGEG